MSTDELSLELTQDRTVVIEATTTVLVESDYATELDPAGEITLQLLEQSFEVVVEPTTFLEVEVPGLQGVQGPRGLAGSTAGGQALIAAGVIQAFHVVAVDAQGLAFQATVDNLAHAVLVLGLAQSAALAGEQVVVVTDGLLETAPVWTLGPLFLGQDGSLVSDLSLAPFQFQLQVAVAASPSLLIVRPQFPIFLQES